MIGQFCEFCDNVNTSSYNVSRYLFDAQESDILVSFLGFLFSSHVRLVFYFHLRLPLIINFLDIGGPVVSAGGDSMPSSSSGPSIRLDASAFDSACEGNSANCSSGVVFTQYNNATFFRDGSCDVATPVVGASINGQNSTRGTGDIVVATFPLNSVSMYGCVVLLHLLHVPISCRKSPCTNLPWHFLSLV